MKWRNTCFYKHGRACQHYAINESMSIYSDYNEASVGINLQHFLVSFSIHPTQQHQISLQAGVLGRRARLPSGSSEFTWPTMLLAAAAGWEAACEAAEFCVACCSFWASWLTSALGAGRSSGRGGAAGCERRGCADAVHGDRTPAGEWCHHNTYDRHARAWQVAAVTGCGAAQHRGAVRRSHGSIIIWRGAKFPSSMQTPK